MSGRENGSTVLRLLATPATKSGIVTVSTKSVPTQESAIVNAQVEKKRKGTETGGTERKRRDATSPHAAAAGGGTTARKATATEGTNTRRARGARRAKRPARISAQTKKTRRPWSSDLPPPVFSLFVCLSPLLSFHPLSHQDEKEGREKMSVNQQNQKVPE